MRMLKRAAVALITVGSIAFLAAGVAYADPGGKVVISKKQVQVCNNNVEKEKNEAKHNKHTTVGSNFICTQSAHIG